MRRESGPPDFGPARMGEADLKRTERVRRLRRLWRTIPSPPRCKMCTRPFGPPGGPIMRLVGLGPWPGNPKYCRGCFRDLYRNRNGAEIECTLLFADMRGSTRLGESMSATRFRAVMDRFYATAAEILVEHEAIVDKFVGDEVIGIFIPALTDGQHAGQAVAAGLELLRASATRADAPWPPIGIGVHTGPAYVGAVGTAEHVEFTALGDTVNTAARVAAEARAGELLVTEVAARAAGPSARDWWRDRDRRRLELRGKREATDVVVLTAGGRTESEA